MNVYVFTRQSDNTLLEDSAVETRAHIGQSVFTGIELVLFNLASGKHAKGRLVGW